MGFLKWTREDLAAEANRIRAAEGKNPIRFPGIALHLEIIRRAAPTDPQAREWLQDRGFSIIPYEGKEPGQ